MVETNPNNYKLQRRRITPNATPFPILSIAIGEELQKISRLLDTPTNWITPSFTFFAFLENVFISNMDDLVSCSSIIYAFSNSILSLTKCCLLWALKPIKFLDRSFMPTREVSHPSMISVIVLFKNFSILHHTWFSIYITVSYIFIFSRNHPQYPQHLSLTDCQTKYCA